MLMADVLQWVAIAAGFVVSLPALWMLARALGPGWFERRVRIQGPGKSLLVGLAPLLVAIVVLAVLGKRLGPLPGLWLGGLVLLWGLLGAAGLAAQVGARLWPEDRAWRQSRNGGLVLACAALLPLVGWFILLPLIAIGGMGIQVRAWFQPKDKAAAAPLVPCSPPAMPAAEPPVLPGGAI
jgi:hypothetical protein